MKDHRWNKDFEFQFKSNMLLCALSLAYAKKHNAHITMHTDKDGYEILSKFPYDEVYCDLDALNDKLKSSSTILWAAGKSIALENEPLGTIHIDNDVFITKSECLDAMNFDDYDFIFQHIETAGYKEKEKFKDIINNFYLFHDFACCVGIIGFNSELAKRTYLDNYKYWFENLEYKEEDKFINADLLLEQMFLYNMFLDDRFKGKSLIGDIRKDKLNDIYNKAANIGYQHAIGRTKFIPFVQKKFYNQLKEINPYLAKIIDEL